MSFKNIPHTESIDRLKLMLLVLVPLSLVFSMKLNSYIIIGTFLVFIPSILKNKKKLISKHFLSYFVPLSTFLICVLIGVFIDLYYGYFDVKKLERLLSFIIFPIIFFAAYPKTINKIEVVKLFSLSITVINVFLFLILVISSLKTTHVSQFQNSEWIKSNIEIMNSNIMAPNQKDKASLIVENNKEGLHDLLNNSFDNIESEALYTRSVYLKSLGREWVLIRQFDGFEHHGIWFNISEGTIGHQQNGVVGKIEQMGDGWYRCSVTNKTTNRSKRERIQITIAEGNKKYAYKGDDRDAMYIWGGQIEKGKLVSPYDAEKVKFINKDAFLNPLEIHPTYYSILIIFSILFFSTIYFSKYKTISIIAILVNIAVIIIISAKGPLFSLLIILSVFILYYAKKNKNKAFYMAILLGMSFVLIMMSSGLKKRIYQTFDTVYYGENPKLSTSKRIIVWQSIFKFPVKDLVIGMGNTHGDNLLKKNSELSLNAHNQYFQALLNSGFIGLLLLFIYLFSPLFDHASKNKNFIFLIGLILLIGINFLFESILNRQWGIVFVSFFYALLNSIDKKYLNENTT